MIPEVLPVLFKNAFFNISSSAKRIFCHQDTLKSHFRDYCSQIMRVVSGYNISKKVKKWPFFGFKLVKKALREYSVPFDSEFDAYQSV